MTSEEDIDLIMENRRKQVLREIKERKRELLILEEYQRAQFEDSGDSIDILDINKK